MKLFIVIWRADHQSHDEFAVDTPFQRDIARERLREFDFHIVDIFSVEDPDGAPVGRFHAWAPDGAPIDWMPTEP